MSISIPGYQVIREIGEGGMCVVYQARHETFGEVVAIKVLHEIYSRQQSMRERFSNEARIMRGLNHKNIVTVRDFLQFDNRIALVMDYIEGRTLDHVIGREIGPMPHEKAIPLFRQILSAVSYAHEHGVVHRDLKPSNILVTAEGEVRVTDFGIAKVRGIEGHTRTGTQLGTPYYMSPEQIRNPKEVDHRADIYSLGMTLYEMLAGRLPFEAGRETSEFEVTHKIVFEKIEPPDMYYPHIPKWLVEVVMKAISKDPEDRFQGCQEFMRALEAPVGKVSATTGATRVKPSVQNRDEAAISHNNGKAPSWLLPSAGIASVLVVSLLLFGGDRNQNSQSRDSSQAPISLEVEPLASATGPLPAMTFLTIPAGSFQMGSPSSESGRDSDEKQHRVTVRSFELMTTEVTQGMWREVMGTNPASGRGVGDNYPVYNVSWNDCQEFIAELNDLDSRYTYRLPTEAEWEYACRAGTTTRFYWGNSDSSSDIGRYTWYDGNSNSATHPVGQKLPNTWGLYDMSGNVWEWCQDVYTSNYDNCPTDGSAYTGSGSFRVERGGGWSGYARLCRSAYRGNGGPGSRYSVLGFRLARSSR